MTETPRDDKPKPARRPRIKLPFDNRREDVGSWTYDPRIGLCVTLIAYLVLMIGFVSSKIVVGRRTHQQGMYIDLQTLAEMEQERDRLEREVRERQRQEEIDWRSIRNQASNENALNEKLRDDRGTNAAALNEARMRANREAYEQGLAEERAIRERRGKEDGAERQDRKVKGRVTVSFSITDPVRTSRYLEVPAYLCEGGGDVTVSVTVDRAGKVTGARVTEGGDAVEAWRAHCAYLEEMAGRLNALQLRQVRYKNALGTDVVVGLPDEHVWMAGADTAKSGVRFVANMPTEEIFSAPKRDAVDGVLAASKPLALNGNVIEGIRLTLEHGRIVGIHADTNEEVLRQAIETDEGAHYLGEIALVPVDSPIAQSGLLFYNTLFDENAACHFAFGQAYPACVPGGDDLPEEELVRRGINVVSTMHVDFMVGTEDLSIIGTTKDGREVTVFENGRFAL